MCIRDRSKLAVRDFIKRVNQEKKTTVILTTHDTQDLEALTQRILLIGKGRILLDGTIEELKARYGQEQSLEEAVVSLYQEYAI